MRDLTPRECQVLQGVAKGAGYKQVAIELGIARSTIKNHMSDIIDKLDVDSGVGAVMEGVRRGVVEI